MLKYLLILLSLTLLSNAQQVVAHRGASHDAPENTIPAFELAWERGADYIEGDFFLTADKKIICTHDKSTKRFSSKNLNIGKSVWADLKEVDVGSKKGEKFKNVRMPLLAEVIATIPKGKGLFLEIKCGSEIVPYLKAELEKSDLTKIDLQIICFNIKVLKECHKLLPNIKTQWLQSFKKKEGKAFLSNFIKKAKANGVSGIASNIPAKFIPEDSRSILKEAGLTLNVWTVNSTSGAQALVPHVDYLTTDKPALISKELKK